MLPVLVAGCNDSPRGIFDVDNVATCSYIVRVKTVGIRELKNRLSEYVREVRLGERVLVSDRGVIVAELREAAADGTEGVPSGLAALARDGQVTLASFEGPPAYPRLRRPTAGPSARRIPSADRGAR
jgi:antitoxin (DNA-binding transcriptional repressor) of toxin-antitoxin stability system